MARGRLARVELPLNDTILVYECPSKVFASISINICNPYLEFPTKIDIAIVDPEDEGPLGYDYIYKNVSLFAGEAIELTGIVINTGQKIMARSAILSGILVNIYGFEEIKN